MKHLAIYWTGTNLVEPEIANPQQVELTNNKFEIGNVADTALQIRFAAKTFTSKC